MNLLRRALTGVSLMLATAQLLTAQSAGNKHNESDSNFAELQARGKSAMGVDQYSSIHRFDDLPDGGRIELQRDSTDSDGVRTIREHLSGIARSFSQGDFSTPGFVHDQQVPGTATMRSRRSAIRYRFLPLPGGGEVRITTRDPAALRAIHQFLAFQRREHHVGPHGSSYR